MGSKRSGGSTSNTVAATTSSAVGGLHGEIFIMTMVDEIFIVVGG